MRLGSVAHAHLIGLTCELKGPREQDAFTETEYGVTARRRPDALYMPRETTEAGPRRIPTLVACGGLAVGTEKSRYQQHVESYDPGCERLRCPCPGLVKMSGRERGTLSAVD